MTVLTSTDVSSTTRSIRPSHGCDCLRDVRLHLFFRIGNGLPFHQDLVEPRETASRSSSSDTSPEDTTTSLPFQQPAAQAVEGRLGGGGLDPLALAGAKVVAAGPGAALPRDPDADGAHRLVFRPAA